MQLEACSGAETTVLAPVNRSGNNASALGVNTGFKVVDWQVAEVWLVERLDDNLLHFVQACFDRFSTGAPWPDLMLQVAAHIEDFHSARRTVVSHHSPKLGVHLMGVNPHLRRDRQGLKKALNVGVANRNVS